ncbi:E3 ubiquitin-protein ligase TRIM32 [Lates japonicus]|uniref:E3 ubiquitin-protein ligase TRIM32 n=1 Tax=Lates japonicus TaxID=270547 RepID=A0AAD3R4E3_LATJO|nr:E3 ubiquitin-protein ligase TRIM32 [Lates japonicus]
MPSGQFGVSDVEGGESCGVWQWTHSVGVVSYNRLCSAVRPKFVTSRCSGTMYFTRGPGLNFEKAYSEPHLEVASPLVQWVLMASWAKQLSHFFSETEDFRCITGMCVDASRVYWY